MPDQCDALKTRQSTSVQEACARMAVALDPTDPMQCTLLRDIHRFLQKETDDSDTGETEYAALCDRFDQLALSTLRTAPEQLAAIVGCLTSFIGRIRQKIERILLLQCVDRNTISSCLQEARSLYRVLDAVVASIEEQGAHVPLAVVNAAIADMLQCMSAMDVSESCRQSERNP